MSRQRAASPSTSVSQKDDTSKIRQDISILAQRIADLSGETSTGSTTGNSSSSFVSGLRNVTDAERKGKDVKDMKIEALESLLEKVAEFDRIVLQRTVIVDPTVAPVRRKSAGMDLYAIPTHLHITDRLLDLFAQSKRVTVIKTTAQITQQATESANDKRQLETLKTQVSKLTTQLEECDQRRQRSEEESVQLKRECEELKRKLADTQSAVPRLSLSADFVSDATKAQLNSQEALIAQLQERLEAEAGLFQAVVTVVFGKASRINSDAEVDMSLVNNNCVNLPENMRNAFLALETAIGRRMEGLRSEVKMVLSVKELLEGELSSSNLQRDMLHTDYNTLSSEHEALKTAYHELSLESATGANFKGSNVNDLSLQSQLKDANDSIIELQSSLNASNRKVSELEKLSAAVTALELQLQMAGDEKIRLDATVSSQVEEIKQYLKLTETLKEKIKDLAGSNAGTGKEAAKAKDFLDSFEEVMREEMLTMKGAFEAKLRAAKEAADATSKRHQQEIMRIHTGSPYTALKR